LVDEYKEILGRGGLKSINQFYKIQSYY